MQTERISSQIGGYYHAALVLLFFYNLTGIAIRQDAISLFLIAVFTSLLLLPIVKELSLLGLRFKAEKNQ
jgi:hypothetical protein